MRETALEFKWRDHVSFDMSWARRLALRARRYEQSALCTVQSVEMLALSPCKPAVRVLRLIGPPSRSASESPHKGFLLLLQYIRTLEYKGLLCQETVCVWSLSTSNGISSQSRLRRLGRRGVRVLATSVRGGSFRNKAARGARAASLRARRARRVRALRGLRARQTSALLQHGRLAHSGSTKL